MNTEMLLKEFKNILELEKRAKFSYDHYVEQIDDVSIREELTFIRDEEIAHIKIVERLIELVS
ncbi:MAG: hypothetical protein HQ594_05530 [Candidatus Omnitrophica bacterium]|nr:hypothetical protein [Candidatus Omnitrophota bacterium]